MLLRESAIAQKNFQLAIFQRNWNLLSERTLAMQISGIKQLHINQAHITKLMFMSCQTATKVKITHIFSNTYLVPPRGI
jgi:hypothetical protein